MTNSTLKIFYRAKHTIIIGTLLQIFSPQAKAHYVVSDDCSYMVSSYANPSYSHSKISKVSMYADRMGDEINFLLVDEDTEAPKKTVFEINRQKISFIRVYRERNTVSYKPATEKGAQFLRETLQKHSYIEMFSFETVPIVIETRNYDKLRKYMLQCQKEIL